jgi:S1-C subfamily serine protease
LDGGAKSQFIYCVRIRRLIDVNGLKRKMKSLRVLNWKTVRYVCGLALAASVVYFAANLPGFYPEGGGANNVVSNKIEASPIPQTKTEPPSLKSHKEMQERNPPPGTGDVQQSVPLQQGTALPTDEPNWDDRSSLGYAQVSLKVRLKPFIKGGNQEGFEVKSIHGDSPLKAIGLENGDIIKSINGEPIDSDLDILQISDAINDGDSYTVSVVRDGEPITLSSEIK